MSRAVLVVIALIAVIAGLFSLSRFSVNTAPEIDPTDVSQWTEYKDLEGRFKIKFPAAPEHASHSTKGQEDTLRLYDIYAAKSFDGTIYIVTEISFPPDVKPAEKEGMIQAIVQEMVQSKPTNELISAKDTTFQGKLAVDFIINNGDDTQINGVAFADSNILYSLTRIAPKNSNDEEKFKQYTDSFLITPKVQVK